MMSPTRHGGPAGRDPKDIVTPYAFRVLPSLLGTPLAGPGRRLVAMLVDLTVVGLVLLVKEISVTLFGFLVAWVLWRVSSPNTRIGGHSEGGRRNLRAAAVVALVISVGLFVGNCFGGPSVRVERPDVPDVPDVPGAADAEMPEEVRELGLTDLIEGATAFTSLRQAESREQAEAAARRLALRLREAGVPANEIEEALSEMMGPAADSVWADEVLEAAVAASAPPPVTTAADTAPPVDSLFERHARAVQAGDTAAARELRGRIGAVVAAESTAAVRAEERRLRRQLAAARAARDEARQAREEAEDRGIGVVAAFRSLLDDLGLGVGWMGIYFTVLTVLTGGQTVGKRLLGIRVVRLTGEPIGWWTAFGRFGGYAASLATGLLGFLEIFWDANRQCLQDKLARTVVIRSGRGATADSGGGGAAGAAGRQAGGPTRGGSPGAARGGGTGAAGRSHGSRRTGRSGGPSATALALAALLPVIGACGADAPSGETVLTFPGSAVGAEAEVLARQLVRFTEAHPDIRVEQRRTPDAADQRHQLYVQWLNAGADDPDILQLDVIWTPEFAAAGWILPLDRFGPERDAFFPATVTANTWEGALYALPWFVDVGMLYWRTDLMDGPPETFEALVDVATRAREGGGLPYGFVWQGARYEGLVTVFLEHLGGFGGRIMDDAGRVTVDSEAGAQALRFLRDAVHGSGISPRSVLTWQEEQTRFAFQNGGAAFMRNWPYAYPLMQDTSAAEVAGRFAVAPMPAAPAGASTAALGGSQLAINANTEAPEAAWALIEYLTRPEQMLERARAAGQYPTRPALYDDPDLAGALAIDADRARRIIERAVPRPVTPVYTQLSGILQVRLHRALTGQSEPREALAEAAREMRALLEEVGLDRPRAR